jgi:hypothetical protein
MKMNVLQFSETVGTIYRATQRGIPEELNIEFICFTAREISNEQFPQ